MEAFLEKVVLIWALNNRGNEERGRGLSGTKEVESPDECRAECCQLTHLRYT